LKHNTKRVYAIDYHKLFCCNWFWFLTEKCFSHESWHRIICKAFVTINFYISIFLYFWKDFPSFLLFYLLLIKSSLDFPEINFPFVRWRNFFPRNHFRFSQFDSFLCDIFPLATQRDATVKCFIDNTQLFREKYKTSKRIRNVSYTKP
jgi:hypothetical protein